MKLFVSAMISTFIFQSFAFAKDEVSKVEVSKRKPNQAENFFGQVQLCAGTEALGNEGQGMGASAFINVYPEMNSQVKPAPIKCDLAFAFAYEYGNDRGIKLGDIEPFNMMSVPVGKTDCLVTQENGEITLRLTKAVNPNSKSKRPAKVLVENCKVSVKGF